MEKKKWNRRDWLKITGGATVAGSFSKSVFGRKAGALPVPEYENKNFRKPDTPVRCIVLGAGNRGNVYARYSEKFPDELQIVGVAEPIEFRRENFAKRYNIDEKYQWTTWEHALELPKFADALIITMPDALHYLSAMQGMALGYDLLLEKAIAQTWLQCNDILQQSRKYNNIVAICHVLRYTSYFRKMKEIIDSGTLGDIVSVQHLEPVSYWHMAHSFVRGPWRNKEESNAMILTKSCHDTDILRWLIGKPCKTVSSFGSLKHFRQDKAPEGSTARCTDDCKVRDKCPYNALKYVEHKNWTWHLEIPDTEDETILRALKTGPFGKCVYRTDNDVVDHQTMMMQFEDEITASFNMEAFTHYGGRRTRVFGTEGDIIGDEKTLTATKFLTGEQEKWDVSMGHKIDSGHGGGDHGLMHDFIQAVSQRDASLLTSTIEASMESHLMGFKAEESRLNNGQPMAINLDE
ncbi:MAG: gfo/Idh/MocA family oxidoreductase [Calditrichaeota bacterium]|nr:MAG: gfo/Idh/MocA family oxidoreductase [Calditrichota bacterium]